MKRSLAAIEERAAALETCDSIERLAEDIYRLQISRIDFFAKTADVGALVDHAARTSFAAAGHFHEVSSTFRAHYLTKHGISAQDVVLNFDP